MSTSKEGIRAQFISKDNEKYLNTLTDDGRIDRTNAIHINASRQSLETFMEAHIDAIDIRMDFWDNVRKLNKLYMDLRNMGREIPFKEQVIKLFMRPKNLEYLRTFTKLPERDHLMRCFEFSRNDALDYLENFDDFSEGSEETLAVNREIQKKGLSKAYYLVEKLNDLFAKGYGNADSEEAYHMQAFINDSLAPAGYENMNRGPKGTLYVGPMQKDDTISYDGNKLNMFSIYGTKKQRYEKFPYWQMLSTRNVDRNLDGTFGLGDTEYHTAAFQRGDIDRLERTREKTQFNKSYLSQNKPRH